MAPPATALLQGTSTRQRRDVAFLTTIRKRRRCAVAFLALLAFLASSLPSIVWGQKVPVGAEFEVNSYTTGEQGGYYHRPRVASDAAGNFVVVWDGDSEQYGAQARQFSSTGVPRGPEFLIDWGSEFATVASDAAGNFVVAYVGDYCEGYLAPCVRRFDSTGTALGPGFRVETGLVYYSWDPKVASDAAGNFVVVWPGDSVATGEYGHVWARRFDSTGTPLGTEFQVSTSYSPQCCWGRAGEDWDGLEIASDAAGNFMVVWNQDNNDVFARVFDSTGVPAGPDFAIDTGGDVHYPQAGVAADGAGHFIVAWRGHRNEGIRGQRFDTAGATVGAEFQVTEVADYYQFGPKVTADAAGNFVVVWTDSNYRDGSSDGIFGRQFDSAATPLGPDFQVNTYTYERQENPSVAHTGNGDFVVVWSSWYQDADYSAGIFGQRFGVPGPFGCAPAPMEGCGEQDLPRRGAVSLKDKFPDTRDRLRWKWVRGSAISPEDLGDPFGGETDYAVCIYDASWNPQPLLQEVLPGGGMCPGRPCWKQLGASRFEYRNQVGPGNFLRLFVKTGEEGRARLGVIGKGDALDMADLPLEPPVTVQFQTSAGTCWESHYSAFVQRNTAEEFRARPGSLCGEATEPECNGVCPAWQTCTDVGSSCECLPACASAGSPQCNGTCPAGLECIDMGSGCECVLPCADAATPACGGVCPPGKECTDTGSSCQCLTPCTDAAAPACNGDCLGGLECIDTGSGCECLTACADTAAPQCGGACVPGKECTDTGSSCLCLTPCADAAAPACNGDCLGGLECIDTGSDCECLTACADTAAPQCGGACPSPLECGDDGSGCVCAGCGDSLLGPGEECDDGNVTGGDGCSSECLCNPATTPAVCNLTGDWIAEIVLSPEFPSFITNVTFIEDQEGNGTFSAEEDPYFPFILGGESTRSDSCGTGTAILFPFAELMPVRLTVADDCNSMEMVIESGLLTTVSLDRL